MTERQELGENAGSAGERRRPGSGDMGQKHPLATGACRLGRYGV